MSPRLQARVAGGVIKVGDHQALKRAVDINLSKAFNPLRVTCLR